jgi:predicted alpha/beta hydrolase family esterase
MTPQILIHPGLYNSAPGHWQSIWEATLPNALRVQQTNWDTPDRTDWVAMLDAAIAAAPGPIILVSHSLGCATSAWWTAEHGRAPHASKVKGALLVAPPDVEDASFPDFITGFAPMPRLTLPFKSIVVASADDPWCALVRARTFAAAWGAEFHDIGARGHINGDSGLNEWVQGRAWLAELEGSLA